MKEVQLSIHVYVSVKQYLHIMNVAVKPAVERAQLRAHQDEGLGYGRSLQESVQVVHHAGRQQHSSVSAQKPGHAAN